MAITYMTKDGYDKKMKEIAYLESVERPRISAAKRGPRATFRRIPSMMPRRKRKVCLK